MENIDYYDFYSKHLKLIPSGTEHQFKALCPFHDNTNTPAMSVNTQKGVWTCFGKCQSSGGVRDFIERLGHQSKSDVKPEDYQKTITECHANLSQVHITYLQNRGITLETIKRLLLGSLGHKIVYPYFNQNGSCTGYKAISADLNKDTFFKTHREAVHLFNLQSLLHAVDAGRSTILLAEGEKDTLVLAQAGYDVLGVSGTNGFKKEYVDLLKPFSKIVVVFDNDEAGRNGANKIAELIGRRCFIYKWNRQNQEDHHDINDYFLLHREHFREVFDNELSKNLIQPSPSIISVTDRLPQFEKYLSSLRGGKLIGFDVPCFPELTKYMKGIRGMIGLGAPPKIGKSTLAVQIASEVAAQKYPVLYYDFENGYNRIVLKLISRTAQVHPDHIQLGTADYADKIQRSKVQVEEQSRTLFIENDRRLNEDVILSHIRRVKEQTGHDKVLIVIDSVQKLPMNLMNRREGIDSWIRFLENIRDNENASLIVISELARSGYDQCGIGSWKESGDLEYSFDHMMQFKRKNPDDPEGTDMVLNMIASRELESGEIATYRVIKPYWYFKEIGKGFF